MNNLPDRINKFIRKQSYSSGPLAGKSGFQPFHCPKCGSEMRTRDRYKYKCPKCKHKLGYPSKEETSE